MIYLFVLVTNAFKIAQLAFKVKRQLLFSIIIFFSLNTASWSTTYYVDTKGNNANSGTSLTTPFRTIQKSMDTAVAGDTIYVRGGVYREQVDVYRGGGTSPDKMLRVQAYENEVPIIRGSDQVTGWTLHSGNIWKKTNWAYNSQQVFVGGGDTPSLQQIGTPALYTSFEYPKPTGSGLTTMVPGSFYYDAYNKTLYVWLADGSDPNTQMIEASTRHRLFFMGVPYIHLKGFAFRHSNTSAHAKMGAAVELSSNSIIELSDIQYTDFAGLSMGYLKTGAQALNCNVSNNGNSGVNAAGSYNFKVFNVKMNNNNTRKFNALWHAGGLKATTKAYGTVEYSEVGFNNGSGIWFDFANSGNMITIRNNYIHDNGPLDAAIYFEVSKNGRIYNNILANNQRRGIYISGSDNTQVFNNTVYGTVGYSAIEMGGMPRTGATLTGNSVMNNIVSHGTTKYDLFMMPANGTTISGNISDYNNYYRNGSAVLLNWGSLYYGLTSFATATKMEMHSISTDPRFVSLTKPTTAKSFAVDTTSSTINSGISNTSIQFDYVNTPRPTGGSFDMGAFEQATATIVPVSSNVTKPIVSIYSPTPNTSITKGSSMTITAKATGSVRIREMSIYVDGVPSMRSSGDVISYTWSSANARIGTHNISISAIDDKNNIGKQVMTFVVK